MIADLIMPGMNGIELMKKAGTIVPTISTVIITAHGTIQTAIAAMREGAYDYIEKPFCPEKVELIVRNLVEHHNLIEENISLGASEVTPERVHGAPRDVDAERARARLAAG